MPELPPPVPPGPAGVSYPSASLDPPRDPDKPPGPIEQAVRDEIARLTIGDQLFSAAYAEMAYSLARAVDDGPASQIAVNTGKLTDTLRIIAGMTDAKRSGALFTDDMSATVGDPKGPQPPDIGA